MNPTFTVINTRTDARQCGLSLRAASKLLMLDEAEVAWAIEEFGKCETDIYKALPEDTK